MTKKLNCHFFQVCALSELMQTTIIVLQYFIIVFKATEILKKIDQILISLMMQRHCKAVDDITFKSIQYRKNRK